MKPHILKKCTIDTIDSPLLKYSKNITSQFGEDGIIEAINQIINPVNKYCIEFGAWDGKYLSNCYQLIMKQGWSGCLIEGDKNKFNHLVINHGSNPKIKCVNRFITSEAPDDLDSILDSISSPKNIDILSIDVDGMDYFIWESMKLYSPRLVIIEFNPTIPNDIIFVQPKDINVNQGASLLAMIYLAKQKGYELICATVCNAFFIKKHFYRQFNIKNNSINSIYKPLQDGRIFQGYDSHIYTCGMNKLIWSNQNITHSDLQYLDINLRKYQE